MNEDCRKRGLSNKKILTVVAISTLLLSSGNVIATQTTIDGSLRVTEQLQTQIVYGLVVDVNGEPVIGASVVEKGTTNGGITDINGKFTLNVKPGSTLQISFVGYQTQEIKATKTVKVVLKEDSELLSEVVVVGYGTQKKANLTGAVATVDVNKTLDSRPIADIGRGLQGSVPGVNITIPTGEIGSDPLIKIRGQIGSISGNNTPLILLDNVEIPSIQMVNPNDVQSISVLKDAASSSIYGSKAAFGVILITTKSGAQTDKFEVSYSNNFSWQDPAKSIEIGGIEALQYTLDAQINRGEPMPAGGFWRISPESLEKAIEWQKQYGGKVKWNDPVVYGRDWYYDGKDKYGYRLYDAAKAMVRNWAPTMSHNLSVNGKSGKTSYNIGLGYLDQSGMSKTAKKDDFKRYNASVSVTSELNKYLTVRASSIYSDRNKRYPGIGNTSADPWLYMYRWSPLFPMGVTEHGNPLKEPSYEMAASNTDNLQNKYYNVNLGFTLNITKNWDVKFDYTYDRQTSETNSSVTQYEAGATWYAPTAWIENGSQVFVNEQGERVDTGGMPAYRFPVEKYYNSSGPGASQVGYQNKSVDNNTFNIYTTYNLELGAEKEHAFKFMVGMNRVTSKWSSHKGWKTNLIDLTNPQFPLASGDQFIEGDRNWEAQLGFFGRLNYSFEDRYFLEANIRRDGSSKFPKNLQWRWFPSFSAGWVFTNESFMKPVENILSFGKFRASWGSIGDQTVSNTLYKAILADGQSSWLDGSGNKMPLYGTPSLVDSDISWQEIETLDFGVDLRFFKNKFGVTFDWYRRDTKNMIIEGESLPVTLGATAPKGNYGSLRTKGWELSADFTHRFSNGLGINVMASISDATTYITKGADYLTPWEDRKLGTTYSTGRRYGDIYGFVTDRLFQKEDFVYGADGQIEKITVIYNGTAHTTNKQSSPYPVYQVHYEDNNKLIFAPGDVKFVDLDGDGYITPGTGTNGNPGDQTVIGNSTPRYEYSFRLGADYKGIDFSIFFQGIGKRQIWGSGQLAIPGYNAKEGALPKTFTTDYWTEERTDAFYPRAWNLGGSNTGFSMQKQSRYLLDMSYLRIKNITLGYTFPENLLSKVYISKARLYMSLENFFTFDKLNGLPIDPEAISGYSMFRSDSNYNLGRTGMGTPVFKTLSCGVQLTF
ncbi:TonB-dependent receptor [Bacteroides stercoris]|jgi:TonB-linked SusC/RagA family outer membrane protein|uniref:TonB-dependent receptor n=1 Tax=Bacteroides stercoris TaxID=46506 RepID=A0A412EBA2_BACSE|nr:TonB-dependent receptor [Bacteroides stercoris]RGR30145.1 TonB-dependent receptor [Bacteroides stercoris]RGR37204.1 TonB-dependent receptor [Bacteroides stercoris]